MKDGTKVTIRQTRSANDRDRWTKGTLDALGLGRIGKSKTHTWNACIAGMVNKVGHLLEVKPAK